MPRQQSASTKRKAPAKRKAPKSKTPAKKREAASKGKAASTFQRFELRTIARSQIQNAPYNPRKIDEYRRGKLLAKVRKRGLLGALIWNESTGNLVGGHQVAGRLVPDERAE